MDILVKILFILSLIVFDVHLLKVLVDNVRGDSRQTVGWGALALVNIILVMVMFIIMHGDYLTGVALLVTSMFGGAVIISVASMLYVEIFDKQPKV